MWIKEQIRSWYWTSWSDSLYNDLPWPCALQKALDVTNKSEEQRVAETKRIKQLPFEFSYLLVVDFRLRGGGQGKFLA